MISKPNEGKINVTFIGPYPPPTGGVATYVKNFMELSSAQEKCIITLWRTGKKDRNTNNVFQVVVDLSLILKYMVTCTCKDIDVVHIHTASYWSFIRNVPYVIISKVFSKSKVVLHVHGGEFDVFFAESSKVLKQVIRYIIQSSDAVIVTSPVWIPILQRIGDTYNSIYAVPNGYVSTDFYPIDTMTARTELNLPRDRKVILTVGGLEPVKGPKYLLEAVQKIIPERKDILCVIVGAGELRIALERQISLLGLEDYVLLAGGKPHDEIPLWMNACDLFVLPSLNEGNPTVMFEALGCGKPFVGTRVGGVPEVITSDEYGLLVEPADPEDLAEKILMALNREWDREAILAYAERYAWENIAKEIMGVYEQVLG
jgi:glycosyltransferase involved in cell wall biosynthesis